MAKTKEIQFAKLAFDLCDELDNNFNDVVMLHNIINQVGKKIV